MDGLNNRLHDFNLGEDDTGRRSSRRVHDSDSRFVEGISREDRRLVINHDQDAWDSIDPRASHATYANYRQSTYDLIQLRGLNATYVDYRQSHYANASTRSSYSRHDYPSEARRRSRASTYRSSKGGSRSRFSSLSVASNGSGESATSKSSVKASMELMTSSMFSSASQLKRETFPVYNLPWANLNVFLEERFPGHFFQKRVAERGYYEFDVPERLTMAEVNNILKLREEGCHDLVPLDAGILVPNYIPHQPPPAGIQDGSETNPNEPILATSLPSELEYITCLNSRTINNRTPLWQAAENGHEAIVQLLLATGKVDVNSKDSLSGRTPLSQAAKNGHEAIVQLLLATGQVDVESKDEYGQTPLSQAAENGNHAVVKLLLATGQVDVDSKDVRGRTPLSWAALNGYEAVVQLLLATGQVDVDSKDIYGQTPLSQAAENGNHAIVKLLLATGKVDINSKDSLSGRTPLSQAAKNGHEAVVQLLLATGKVDVDSKDIYGQTPLSQAAKNGNHAIVKLLLATGKVDVNSKDSLLGRTPLSQAAKNGHEAIVQLLLATGKVDVDSKDIRGLTPLLWATLNGYEAVVQLLLATGQVDVESKDEYGQTPLWQAAENGHEAIVQLLLATGKVDVNSKDSLLGRTPLSQAAKNGHEAIVQLLLATDQVDVDSNKSPLGLKPLSRVAENGHHVVVKLLPAIGKYDVDKPESSVDKIIGARNDSDTNSTCSGDKTDWGDDSDKELPKRKDHKDGIESNMDLLEQTLDQAKFQLVNRLMDEFWIIFNQSWGDRIRSCASGSSSDALPTESELTDSAGVSKNVQGFKRGRTAEGDELGGEDGEGGRAPKRLQNRPELPDDLEEARDFACPFRKYNPRKYRVSIPCWKSCALTPHKTVARVKAHLYKYHLIYQCTRCKLVFSNDPDLERHVNSVAGCEVMEREPVDGITKKMEEQLHSRKKAFKGQTEEQRWDQIYEILFGSQPGVRPSPYFEPVRDMEEQEVTQSPESTNLANFETFLRRELPLLIQNTLKREVDAEINPVEERLRGRMAGWIREATDELFSKYRAMYETDSGSESTAITRGNQCSSLNSNGFGSDWPLKSFQEQEKEDCQKDITETALGKSGCDILDSGYNSNEPAPELSAQLEKSSHISDHTLNYCDFPEESPSAWKGKEKEIVASGHHNADHNEDDHTFSSLDDSTRSEIWGLELDMGFTNHDDMDLGTLDLDTAQWTPMDYAPQTHSGECSTEKPGE